MTLLKIKGKDFIPSSFERLLDDLLSDGDDTTGKSVEFVSGFRPPVNTLERESEFEIQLALPGWEKKDIQLSLDNEVLTVTGKRENLKKEQSWLGSRFEKRFHLPKEAGESINAELKNGVLHIVIAKKAKAETKRAIKVL